jgi:hypothetical protein
MSPVLGEFRVLEKGDVIIGARRGDGIPDALQGLLLIVGSQRDLEDADIIRLGDLGVGQGGSELLSRLEISRGDVVEGQHRDLVALRHAPVIAGARPGSGLEHAMQVRGGELDVRVLALLRTFEGAERTDTEQSG